MLYNFINVKIKQVGITVTATDANDDHFPAITSPSTLDEDGKQFYYRPVKTREAKLELYRVKLGAALARELRRSNENIVIPNGKLFYL